MADLRLFDEVSPVIEDICGVPRTWGIKGLLSKEECQLFLQNVVHDEELDTSAYKRADEVEIFPKRISYRYKADLDNLSLQFFDRIKTLLPNPLVFNQEDSELGSFLEGSWKLWGVNERISFLKYLPGGQFTKHKDGIYFKNEDLRSMITILIYLNDDYEGGRTVLYNDEETVRVAFEPKAGDACAMMQNVIHEGGVVESGEKHAIRLDIIYERDAPYDPQKFDNNQLAMQYLKIAQDLERAHQATESVKYYQRAFRLNPHLEWML
ncbi:unnamed protein product [Blepharisma stoltei]|uniref:Prolyl 4-hydroxylase alpha subunit domain-containing protein n=1 Tax=Blepharisma stoltei TaxID=1481888 RepID=A0AAU9KAY1_9CILI|nr:unnamed protein product [Blepharisma stoltei]